MGVFDGEVTRIRALVPYRNPAVPPREVERWASDDRHAKKIVAGLKGRGATAVMVEDLHYVVHHRADLSYGEDWE